ncbi:MAG: MFS transporter [Pseudomonadota bacterium]
MNFFAYLIFGYSSGSTFLVVAIASVVCGFFVAGGNCGIMALSAVSYPPAIRATGIGAAYAIGKLGTFLAPVLGGFLLSAQWSVFYICLVTGVGGLIASGICVLLQRHAPTVSLATALPTAEPAALEPS